MSPHSFRGMGVALVTPFTEHNEIDYPSLERLLEHLLADRATDFIVIHGTTGESPCLTRQERDEVTRYIIGQVAGRCPLMIGLGGNNTRETAERLAELDPQGLAGVLSVVPYYNKPSQGGMYQHFKTLAAHSPLPLILYNVPGRVGVNMTPETVIRLAQDCDNIIGIKEASGFPQQAAQITSGDLPEGFVVLSGDDSLITPFMQAGAQGVISVLGNAYPVLTSRLTHLAMEGAIKEAEMLQVALQQLNAQLFQEGNPTGIKALLWLMKLIDSQALRLPLLPASSELLARLSKTRDELEGQLSSLLP